MRGTDDDTSGLFSYLSPERRVRHDHPLRKIRALTDAAFAELAPQFDHLYSRIGRPSIPPEQLLCALLVQTLYTIRRERLLMEEIDSVSLVRRVRPRRADVVAHDVLEESRPVARERRGGGVL